MSSSNNVLNLLASQGLHDVANADGSSSSLTDADLPELIKLTKHIAIRKFEQLITTMLNNADDCLFEYAEKAKNNQQQTLYFDAMRELRLRKDLIRKHFFSNFEQSFNKRYADPTQAYSTMSKQTQLQSALRLVEENDLEESLAITHMSQRIFSECREELADMVIRLNYIVEYHKFTKETNPLCPDIICNSFRDATECLTPIIEIKLIVFKLFDKFVIQNINAIYHDINAAFIAADILPIIKYSLPTNTSQASSHSAVAADDKALQSNGYSIPASEALNNVSTGAPLTTQPSNSFESMRAALHQYRTGLQTNPTYIGPGTIGTGGGNTNIAPAALSYYASHDIVDGLTRLQSNHEYTNSNAALSNQVNADIIKTSLLENIVQFRDSNETKHIGRNEADVVDIVSMMFDYILNDSHLPERIKFAIGRLQIPIVKVAILDSTFFSNKSHAARELLNELALTNADIRSTQEHQQKQYEKIDYVTDCILREYKQDSQIFEEMLIEFKEFLENERQVEKIAQEMLLTSRKTVAKTLQAKLKNITTANEVRQFIIGPWKAVLNEVAIKDNAKGDKWNLYLQLIDNLLWSVEPKIDADDRSFLTQQIPAILLVIHQGINQIKQFKQETSDFIKQLEKLHLAALHSNQNNLAIKAQVSTKAVFDSETEKAAATEKAITFNTEAESYNTLQQYLSDPEVIHSPYFDIINRMAMNTWVEFSTDAGKLLGKLSWKSNFTGDYVFMSRTYKPVADLNLPELIKQFEQGSACIASNIPMLDRAIDSVIKTLYYCKGD